MPTQRYCYAPLHISGPTRSSIGKPSKLKTKPKKMCNLRSFSVNNVNTKLATARSWSIKMASRFLGRLVCLPDKPRTRSARLAIVKALKPAGGGKTRDWLSLRTLGVSQRCHPQLTRTRFGWCSIFSRLMGPLDLFTFPDAEAYDLGQCPRTSNSPAI